jgi:hypothetical protein
MYDKFYLIAGYHLGQHLFRSELLQPHHSGLPRFLYKIIRLQFSGVFSFDILLIPVEVSQAAQVLVGN